MTFVVFYGDKKKKKKRTVSNFIVELSLGYK